MFFSCMILIQMDVMIVAHDRSSLKDNSNSSLCKNSNLHTFSSKSSVCMNESDDVISITGCGSETSRISLKSMSSSRSCMWSEPSQPEEEDCNLERTLNSHGSTLLDVYPSMLNQIGEAYRRQHVADVASSVLRRYRRRRWQSNHNHGFINIYNNTLNRTRNRSLTGPKPSRDNFSNHQKFRYQGPSPHRSKLCSPKGSREESIVSTTCFYSPRRDDVEKMTGVEKESCWTEKSQHRPIRVLDLSTPSPVSSPPRSPSPVSSSSRSPSPDLNQTYIVESVPLAGSHSVPASSVCNSTLSPLKMARMASLASQGGASVNSSPYYYRSGLQHDNVCSLTASSPRTLSGHLSQMRSPLKAKIISLEQNQQTSVSGPGQALPVIHTSEVYRSPYKSQGYPSPRLQLPHHQENPIKQLKRRLSFSRHYAPSPSIPQIPSRQIDAEFMSLYHHFICRSTNPTSSCHLCKRRSGVQSPAVSFTHSMSALSLTPVRRRLKKRHREPEVVESLRFKRFRESCSPRQATQFRPNQQQGNRYINSTMVEPSEDRYTWNRALLLQCPSPGFLRAIRHQTSASGSNSKGSGSRLDLQTHLYSPSWVRPSLRRASIEVGYWNNLFSPSFLQNMFTERLGQLQWCISDVRL